MTDTAIKFYEVVIELNYSKIIQQFEKSTSR